MADGSEKERTWALAAHVAAYLGLAGVPFGNVLGPLLVWTFKKDQYPLVREHGRESLNFQISLSAYVVGLLVLWYAAAVVARALAPAEALPADAAPPGAAPLVRLVVFYAGAGALALVLLADVLLIVVGALRAYQGLPHRYPFTFRLVK